MMIIIDINLFLLLYESTFTSIRAGDTNEIEKEY